MAIKKMLFVTDFQELWFDALQSLMDLRKAGLDHIVFLHVIRRDQVAMRRGKGYLKEEELKLKQIANVRFMDWAASIFEQGMECGAYVVVGQNVPKVVSTAQEEKVDLIVMGAHKRTMIEKLYVDSETLELLRRTRTPVLVHKYMLPSGKVNEKPFEAPLFVTDWSSASERALEYIISLKNAMKRVTVAHVISEDSMKGKSKTELQKDRKENIKRLEGVSITLEDEGIEVDTHVCIGEVVPQIQTVAREYGSTMIVAGNTGKGAWRVRWLGSISQELAESSELPTLLVP
jgi:nucleotide-binding universal stress UspA family protein